MILYEILELFNNSQELIEVLGISEEDPKIYPFGTEHIQECIIYKFIPITSDGIKEQNRLELTIITVDDLRGLSILETVKSILLTRGDTQKTSNILEVSLNGGGTLENLETGTIHRSAFFIVKNRIRKD